MTQTVQNPIDKLLLYFQGCANDLENRADKAGLFQNNPDAGEKREEILADFLDRHLPNRCKVERGGHIFDANGNESLQIDVFVANDVSLQFMENRGNRFEKRFNCIEGCYAVVSVKTTLDEASLFDAFDNLKSVPKLQNLQTAAPLANKQSVIEELPVKVVFAYRGVELETLKGTVDMYKKERNIEAKNLPNLIVVNKKYHMSKVSPDGYQEAGKPFQEWVQCKPELIPDTLEGSV
jgi:hypothetical protein